MRSGRLSWSRPASPGGRDGTATTPGATERTRTSADAGPGRAGAPTGAAWTGAPFSTAETFPSSVRTTLPVRSIASTGSSASTATSTSKSLGSAALAAGARAARRGDLAGLGRGEELPDRLDELAGLERLLEVAGGAVLRPGVVRRAAPLEHAGHEHEQ